MRLYRALLMVCLVCSTPLLAKGGYTSAKLDFVHLTQNAVVNFVRENRGDDCV